MCTRACYERMEIKRNVYRLNAAVVMTRCTFEQYGEVVGLLELCRVMECGMRWSRSRLTTGWVEEWVVDLRPRSA